MKTTTYNGWHFLANDGKLRDWRDAPADGEWLHHDGALKLCESGLHWSKEPLDALRYAPGGLACRIQARGETLHAEDKAVSRERLIVWRVDARRVLRRFARSCALDVAHLWDAPKVVVRYLQTGVPALADEACDAADAACHDADTRSARSAAWYAARAARSTARSSEWYAAQSAWHAAQAAFLRSGEGVLRAARDRQNLLLAVMLEAEHRWVTGDA